MESMSKAAAKAVRYPRSSKAGFYVKTPPTISTPDEIANHLTKSIRSTMPKWSNKNIKGIEYFPNAKITMHGAITAICVSSDQKYFNIMSAICKDMFSDLSATLGEDAIVAMDFEESKSIVHMFKSQKSSIHKFSIEITENPQIRQPSPLPGMPPLNNMASMAACLPAMSYYDPASFPNFMALQGIAALSSIAALPNFTGLPGINNLNFTPLPSINSGFNTTPNTPPPTNSAVECAAPRKRQAEEVDADKPDKAAKRSLSYEPPENPWELKPNHLENLKNFITNTKLWNDPVKYREMLPGEEHGMYYTDKKAAENKHPAIATAMANLIPPIARRTACQSSILIADLSGDHRSKIRDIFARLHCKGWNGVYALLQWPNMNYLYYNFDTARPYQQSLNAIEVHRRIMAIEGAVVEMAAYLQSAICEGRSTLRNVAPKDLSDAYTILASQVTDTQTPAMELLLKITPSVESGLETTPSPITELLLQLKGTRSQALTRHCPFLTELGWGVGLMAMLYSLLESFKRLDEEEEAQTILLAVMGFIDTRSCVYLKDLEPALLYGARLTAYATSVRELCDKFNALKPTPPNLGRFHELDIKGRILKSDGKAVPLGLQNVPAGRETWLLPFPVECSTIVPDPDAEALCSKVVADEQRLITAMLSDLGIDPNPPLIAYMHAGNAKVKSLLQADLPGLHLTRVLPPSASMPTAWFEPDVVFGAV